MQLKLMGRAGTDIEQDINDPLTIDSMDGNARLTGQHQLHRDPMQDALLLSLSRISASAASSSCLGWKDGGIPVLLTYMLCLEHRTALSVDRHASIVMREEEFRATRRLFCTDTNLRLTKKITSRLLGGPLLLNAGSPADVTVRCESTPFTASTFSLEMRFIGCTIFALAACCT